MPSVCYRTPFASPHSSSSSVAVPIRIITTGPTSRGRVFQRCIGQLTRRALPLGHGTARRQKNSSHHHSSWVDQRGQGILHTRRRPRALFLVSSIRYPGDIVPDDASSPLPFNKNPKLRTFTLLQSRLIYWTIVSPASLVSQVVGDERPAPESPRLSVSCKITPGVS